MTTKLGLDTSPGFQAGFDAGYNAQAEKRAVFGSPAYRQGFLYGVSQRAYERSVQAESKRRAERARSWRLLKGAIIGALIGLFLGWVLVKSAGAGTLDDWQRLNEMCQGGSGAVSDKACAQRQRTGAQLAREGWYQGEHGVWVSPEHAATFTRIVRSYDAMGRSNRGMLDKVMEGMLVDLRRTLPDETLFALWNGQAEQLRATAPYAASMLSYGMPYLERTLSGRHDPRFTLALRP